MKLFKRLLVTIAGFILVLAAVAMFLPRQVEVARAIIIKAPAEKVFAQLNSMKNFNAWSPWAKLDPETKYTWSGPDTGVGSKMSWQSNSREVGTGSQEIITSTPSSLIRTSLEFAGQGKAVASFTLVPKDGATQVTWGFKTDLGYNPIARWMGLAFDKLIGNTYEKGLINLQKLLEKT